ncbi:MAG: acetyl-CoA hydrolase/transferase family protein [Bacteroidales bacterium]|nr:acetyl-CoA hydrolase/transferase family protein [Bacteroidales bacterium]
MDWKEEYKTKQTTAEEAIKSIKPGDTVVMSECAGVPRHTIQAMAAHRADFHDVTIYHMLTLGDGECFAPECYDNFRHLSNFLGGNSRQAVWSGHGEFFPAYFKDIPPMLGNEIPCDVALVTVTPPNAEGYCSVSLSCDYAVAAIKKARVVIAEANDRLPFVGGGTLVHVSELTHIVPCSYDMPELAPAKIGDVEAAIGRNCASLVEDGATLQLGIGAIPDAVLMALGDKHDLGIHTEMFSDGVVDLVEKGVINGSRKTLHQGKLVATFLMGTKKLYDFVNNNPMVELYGVDYVNDPYVIAKNDRMVAINSCIEIDLMGQVASETMGIKQFSGTGGQVDYVRGAAMSREGKSIMAMPSTAAKGKVSRIVPFLAEGAAVTTSRNDVDYVVTEYGIAHLKGKTLRQRAEALIAIAHPDFRPMLQEEYEKRFNK